MEIQEKERRGREKGKVIQRERKAKKDRHRSIGSDKESRESKKRL